MLIVCGQEPNGIGRKDAIAIAHLEQDTILLQADENEPWSAVIYDSGSPSPNILLVPYFTGSQANNQSRGTGPGL